MKNNKFMKAKILSKYKYIYHRGFHDNKLIPENSILAFKKCIEMNGPIELDLRLLKCNTVVVFHDNDLKRLCGINKKTNNCTYEEIKNYKLLNTNETIPTLNDVLKLVNNKVPLNIEFKDSGTPFKLEKRAIKLLDNYKGDFIVTSFNLLSLIYFRLFRNNYIRGLLIGKSNKIQSLFKFLANPDFLVCNSKLNNIKKYKNKPIFIYNLKDKEQAKMYSEYDGFII